MNHPKSALVIDDSEPVRTTVADILRGCGLKVFEAATSAEAIAILAAEQIALVVADLYLDEQTSGATFLKQAVQLHAGLKGILMLGSMVPAQKTHTAFPVLSKPFPPRSLIELAERLPRDQD